MAPTQSIPLDAIFPQLLLYYFDRGSAVRQPIGQRPSTWLTPIAEMSSDIPDGLVAALKKPNVNLPVFQHFAHEDEDDGYTVFPMLGKQTALVHNPTLSDAVLIGSPKLYETGEAQIAVQQQFQPNGLAATNRPTPFKRRRGANESMLQSEERAHDLAAYAIEHVLRAAGRIGAPTRSIRWGEIDEASREATAMTLWGHYDQTLVGLLELMMARGNLVPIAGLIAAMVPEDKLKELLGLLPADIRMTLMELMAQHNKDAFKHIPLPDPARFQKQFDSRVIDRLPDIPDHALASYLHALNADDTLNDAETPHQLTHWLFAMRGTVAVTATYALALLSVSTERQNAMAANLIRAGGIERYADILDSGASDHLDDEFERVVLEAARLFPPVPMVIRRVSSKDDRFEGAEQVLLHHALNNRLETFAGKDPQRFRPERWDLNTSQTIPRTIKLGADFGCAPLGLGGRVCPGRRLGVLMSKLLIASLLERFEFVGVDNDAFNRPRMNPDRVPMVFDQFGICLRTRPRRSV